MSQEPFEQSTTAPDADRVEDHEVVELTLEQTGQVSGGGIVHRY
jgi:hypothetical protein